MPAAVKAVNPIAVTSRSPGTMAKSIVNAATIQKAASPKAN